MSESTDKDLSIQNDFFNQARKSRSRVTIFLSSGKRLVGRIKAFDRFAIILDAGGGGEEMIFKHAIATISTLSRPPMTDGRPGEFRPSRTEPPAKPAGMPGPAETPSSPPAPNTPET